MSGSNMRPGNANVGGLRAGCLLAALALTYIGGCSRAYYRVQADRDAYHLVQQKERPDWQLNDYTINTKPESRMFEPGNPDFPPMPPDDPAAHRLMHCVDCKKGWPCWHCSGDTPFVQNPLWMSYLPLNEDGSLKITSEQSVLLALLNSPEYQQELEDLYLSALDVSFERFRFDSQFFAGYQADYLADGPLRNPGAGSQSVLALGTFPAVRGIRMNKLFAQGGELVVGLANSLVWQFSGTDSHSATTLLDFAFVQPLLRGAGQERVLERLTVSERTLLSNVRQMERFRRGFYLEVTTGRNAGQGPTRRGGVFGGSGLEGFTGTGAGGFGRVGAAATGVTGGAGAAQAGGYLGLLQEQLNIANQESNIASLRSSLAQLESFFQAGRIDFFQVELARQALFTAQSFLLNSRTQYQSRLDDFKVVLGVPPQLELRVEDTLLDQFKLIDPAIVPLQDQLAELQLEVGATILQALPKQDEPAAAVEWNEALARRLTEIRQRLSGFRAIQAQVMDTNVPRAAQDIQRLREQLPARRRELESLAAHAREAGLGIDKTILDVSRLEQLPAGLEQALRELQGRFAATLTDIDKIELRLQEILEKGPQMEPNELANLLRIDVLTIPNELTEMSAQVLELILIQARARTESITLVPVEVEAAEALEVARVNRLDWMNARSNLVDSWRLIAFNANDLESGLDVVFSGDISNVGDNPLSLRDTTGRLRAGLQFDAPLTRLAERNVYRQSLIEYQQARRSYYQFEDAVARTLRNTVRTIDLHKLNFELRRAAINVAVGQVELTRLRLQEPPQPNVEQVFGATTARDLVNALADLLNVQNDFISVWVNYEVQRRSLEFDMGTMQLDSQGLWIDPGPLGGEYGIPGQKQEPPPTADAPLVPDAEELPPPREGEIRVELQPPA